MWLVTPVTCRSCDCWNLDRPQVAVGIDAIYSGVVEPTIDLAMPTMDEMAAVVERRETGSTEDGEAPQQLAARAWCGRGCGVVVVVVVVARLVARCWGRAEIVPIKGQVACKLACHPVPARRPLVLLLQIPRCTDPKLLFRAHLPPFLFSEDGETADAAIGASADVMDAALAALYGSPGGMYGLDEGEDGDDRSV